MKSFAVCAALLLALQVSSVTARTILADGSNANANANANANGGGASANAVAQATAGNAPVVPPSSCSNAKSSQSTVSGTSFSASLSGQKNVKPNTTGTLMPVNTPARGTYKLVVDEKNQKASWTLQLCDVPAYTAAHLHTGSSKADYAPPLIPLEPYLKPSDPFAPPNLLPQLCPPVEIKGCSYNAKGSFIASDITPLLGRQPVGDNEVPTVTNFAQFLSALKAGKIYINVHSKLMPAGLIRGNLQADSSSSSSGSSGSSNQESGSKTSSSSANANANANANSKTPSPSPSPSPSPKPSSNSNSKSDTTAAAIANAYATANGNKQTSSPSPSPSPSSSSNSKTSSSSSSSNSDRNPRIETPSTAGTATANANAKATASG